MLGTIYELSQEAHASGVRLHHFLMAVGVASAVGWPDWSEAVRVLMAFEDSASRQAINYPWGDVWANMEQRWRASK